MDQERTPDLPPQPMTPNALPNGRQDGVASAPPPSPAQEVGATLRATRLSRGYSLESVCQHTRISRKYLEALESGRFDDLPAPVYLRSFLTGYCEYLELELRPLWDKLHPAPSPEPAAPATAAAAPAPPAKAPAHPAPKGPGRGAPAAPGAAKPAAPTIPLEASPYFISLVSALGAVSLSVALAASLVWWVAHGSRAGAHAEDFQTPQALLPLRPAVEPKLGIACRDDAWVSVQADGTVLYAGRVPRGTSQEFQAKKIILLRVAAPENLDFTLNGSPYRLPRPDDAGVYRIEAP